MISIGVCVFGGAGAWGGAGGGGVGYMQLEIRPKNTDAPA